MYLDYLLFNYYSFLFCATPCGSREATVLSTSSRKVLCTSQSFRYATVLATSCPLHAIRPSRCGNLMECNRHYDICVNFFNAR